MSGSPVSDFVSDRGLPLQGEPDELRAFEQRLQGFCSSVAELSVDERDEDAATRAYVGALGKEGLLQLVVPAAHGGAHEQVRSTWVCLARQWLARQSGALDTAFVMQGLGSYPVTLAGSDALRAELLPKVARGEVVCAFALTEPEAGSDVANMQTVAQRDGADVVLHGTKCWISNAGVADSYVVFAKEGGDIEGKPAFGAFWIPADAAGLSVTRSKVTAPHPIGTLSFDGVRVPEAHRLGEHGNGLRIAFSTLDLFRVTVGAAALGLADRAISETIDHLKRRVQFGRPLAKQQGLRFAVADVLTEHVAAQLLVYRAAGARDRGDATPDMPAMAKMFATEAAQRAVDRAVQTLGGQGVSVGSVTERLYREVRALRIYEGTTEIQKLVIARSVLG